MPDFVIKEGNLTPEITSTLKDQDGVVNLTGAAVRFHMRNRETGAVKVDAAATIVSPTAGTVKYTWTGTDTDTPGNYDGEWEVTISAKPTTFPSDGYDKIRITEKIA
jgi:hypothetical protein